MPAPSTADDLFFDSLVRGYVEGNARFVRRDWLAELLGEKLEEAGCRFVLVTAEPGAGKSAFIAQLAHDHPDWLRYFIRRDQRSVLADVSARSLLLRVGYQLAAQRPELFAKEQLKISVRQRLGEVGQTGEAVGAEIERLVASPFYRKVLEIEQQVGVNQGKVVGLRVGRLDIEERHFSTDDLLHLALIDPARALQRSDPEHQLVILVDALDEIRYHQSSGDILTWLTNCPELPDNVRFVLTSRPPDEPLNAFRRKQADRLAELAIAEDDPLVRADVEGFVTSLVQEPKLAEALEAAKGVGAAFAGKAIAKAHGNLGYVDALARGIDHALGHKEAKTLKALLSLKELPADLEGLYGFFLGQIKAGLLRERIELRDPETGETYDKAVWPAVHDRILGVLAVAMEPVDADLLERLGGIRAERSWVLHALEGLRQFLDEIDGRYRFYHATVAEFLTAQKTDKAEDPDIQSLYQDAEQRHRQIANCYWRNREDWTRCDDYGLRNLAAHLDAGKEIKLLHELISQEWMRARVAREGHRYSGFITDVMLAWDRVKREALRQIEADDPEFSAFATCFRYALIRTSLNSLSGVYSAVLVRRAYETGIWTFERACDITDRMARAEDRAGTYVALLEAAGTEVTSAQLSGAQRAALSALREIDDDFSRRDALARLASRLGDDLIDELLDAVEATSSEYSRGDLLEKLGEALPHEKLSDLVSLARKLGDEGIRGETLAALVQRFSDDRMKDALAIAESISDPYWQAKALEALAPRLSTDLLAVAADAVRAISVRTGRELAMKARAKFAIALKAGGESASKWLDWVFCEQVRSVLDEVDRMGIVICLVPRLESGQMTRVLRAIHDFGYYADNVLACLAPRLSYEELEEAATIARTFVSPASVAWSLAVLGHRKGGTRGREWVAEALHTAEGLSENSVPVSLLKQLPSFLAPEDFDRVLGMISPIKPKGGNLEGKTEAVLKAIAPYLNNDQLSRALELAGSFEWKGGEAIEALAPYLDDDQLGRAIEIVEKFEWEWECVSALKALSPFLTETLFTRAIAIARDIEYYKNRAEALVGLSQNVRDSDTKHLLLTEALGIVGEVDGREDRLSLLSMLAPHLNATQLTGALAEARVFADAGQRAQTLAALAPRVPEQERSALISDALGCVLCIDDIWDRAQTLVKLADEMDESHIHHVIKALGPMEDQRRAWTLVGIAKANRRLSQGARSALGSALKMIKDEAVRNGAFEQLKGLGWTARGNGSLETQLETARAMDPGVGRGNALASLASRFDGEARETLIREAIASDKAIDDARVRARALANLLLRFPEQWIEKEVLGGLIGIGHSGPRGMALEKIVFLLSEANLEKVVELAQRDNDAEVRATVLIALGECFTGSTQDATVNKALEALPSIWDQDARARLFARLAPLLSSSLLDEALVIARNIERDVPRAVALAVLAKQLNGAAEKGTMQEAFSLLRRPENSSGRPGGVSMLAQHVTPEIEEGIIELIKLTEDDAARAGQVKAVAGQLSTRSIQTIFPEVRRLRDEVVRLSVLVSLPEGQIEPFRTREIRRCFVEFLEGRLGRGIRSEVLKMVSDNAIALRWLVGEAGALAMARHLTLIGERWQWE